MHKPPRKKNSVYRSMAASRTSPALDAIPRERATIPSKVSKRAEMMLKPPAREMEPSAAATPEQSPRMRQVHEKKLGEILREAAKRSKGESNQYANSMGKWPKKGDVPCF